MKQISILQKEIDLLSDQIKEKLDPLLLFERGQLYEKAKQYVDALSDYFLASSLSTDKNLIDQVENKLFVLFDLINEVDQIKFEKELERLIKINPNNQNLMLLIARYYHTLKHDYRRATLYFNKAISIDESKLEPHKQFINYYLSLEKPKKALELALKLVQKFPDHSGAYSLLGTVYLHNQKPDVALSNFDRGIELDPGNTEIIYARSFVYELIDDYKTMINELNKCIIKNPNDYRVYVTRGDAHVHLKNYSDAISDFNTAIELNPDNAVTFLYRSEVYLESGQLNLALNDINQAIEMRSNEPYFYLIRGKIHEKLGNEKQKNEDLYKAMMSGKTQQ